MINKLNNVKKLLVIEEQLKQANVSKVCDKNKTSKDVAERSVNPLKITISLQLEPVSVTSINLDKLNWTESELKNSKYENLETITNNEFQEIIDDISKSNCPIGTYNDLKTGCVSIKTGERVPSTIDKLNIESIFNNPFPENSTAQLFQNKLKNETAILEKTQKNYEPLENNQETEFISDKNDTTFIDTFNKEKADKKTKKPSSTVDGDKDSDNPYFPFTKEQYEKFKSIDGLFGKNNKENGGIPNFPSGETDKKKKKEKKDKKHESSTTKIPKIVTSTSKVSTTTTVQTTKKPGSDLDKIQNERRLEANTMTMSFTPTTTQYTVPQANDENTNEKKIKKMKKKNMKKDNKGFFDRLMKAKVNLLGSMFGYDEDNVNAGKVLPNYVYGSLNGKTMDDPEILLDEDITDSAESFLDENIMENSDGITDSVDKSNATTLDQAEIKNKIFDANDDVPSKRLSPIPSTSKILYVPNVEKTLISPSTPEEHITENPQTSTRAPEVILTTTKKPNKGIETKSSVEEKSTSSVTMDAMKTKETTSI
ncbi:unnamed protein product [Diamesa serratosioi]